MSDQTANAGSSGNTAEKLAVRQAEFDQFMGRFSSEELFGQDLYELAQLDTSAESVRLLADCIEANWIVFDRVGGDAASRVSLASLQEKLKQAARQNMEVAGEGDDDDDE